MARRVKFMVALALCGFWAGSGMADSTADSLERRVQNAIDHNHIVDNLGTGFQNHPSGEFLLAPQNRNIQFGILIYNIDILPTKAVFSAGMAFRDHRSNQLIAFKADDVVFSLTHGITGDVKLHLLDSVLLKLGKFTQLLFKAGPGASYASFNCNGLQQFAISGTANFSQQYLLPVDDSGAIVENKPLTTSFSFFAQNWSDMVAEISVPAFQFKGLKDYVFEVQRVVLDLSETANAPGFYIPTAYTALGFNYQDPAIWEGFYIEKGKITLPRQFQSSKTNKLSFEFSNTLIDEFGFTGDFIAHNLLPIEYGNIGGWGFSIDLFHVSFAMNKLQKAEFRGLLNLPILPDTSQLRYFASIGLYDHYLFSIASENNITIPALKAAQVQLTKNSYVSAEIISGDIKLEANLNGKLSVISSASNVDNVPDYKIPEIRFQEMKIRNSYPKFSIQYLGIVNTKDSSEIGKYPIQLQSISFTSQESNFGLMAKLRLNLTEYAAATSQFNLMCKLDKIGKKDRLVYQKTELSSLEVKFEKSGIGIYGLLQFFKADPDYGNGCQGKIDFKLNEPKITAAARALFGNYNHNRYWYFDAEVLWPAPGIIISPGVNVNGFVGGAWHRLKPAAPNQQLLHPEYGKTASGVVLVPSADAGLGLRAGAYLNGGTEQSYQAKTVLEMHFLKSGALAKTLFYGDIEIMPVKSNPTLASMAKSNATVPSTGNAWTNYCKTYQPTGQVGGPFMIDLDFLNHAYFASAGLFIKQAAANTINGANENYKAGELSAYFSQTKWYIRVGQPDKPLGVKIAIGKFAGITAQSYLMLGTEIPKAPLPPAEVRQYLGQNVKLDANRDMQSLATGVGFAYGMAVTAQASAGGSDKKLSIYANLTAKAAMDVNIRNYGKSQICSQTGKPPGLNGWYGQGNLYAFLQGKVGASAGKFSIDVMTFTGAMQMAFAGPNPLYAEGNTYLGFNLGGIFKFKGYMDVQLGESCDLEQKRYFDSSILRSTYPFHLSKNVDPMANVEVTFNVPVNQAFDGFNGKKLMFRVCRNELVQNGKKVMGNWTFTNNNLNAMFQPAAPLNPNEDVVWNLDLDIVEINGKSTTQLLLNGKPMEEIHTVKFSVGNLPSNIPISNIASTWPIIDQLHYHPGETTQGKIVLKKQQDYLFSKTGTKVIARITTNKGITLGETIATYSGGSIIFALPKGIQTATIYRIRILKVNGQYSLNSGTNNSGSTGSMGSGMTANLGSKQPATAQQELLFEYWFRTSTFSTFKDKINSLILASINRTNNNELEIKYTPNKNELFDCFELSVGLHGPHLKLSTDLRNTNWYTNEIQNKVYAIFKTIPMNLLLKRDTAVYGFPPSKAIDYSQKNSDQLRLSPENIFSNKPITYNTNEVVVKYKTPAIIAQDFEEIKQNLMVLYGNGYPNIQNIIHNYIQLCSAPISKVTSAKTVGTAMSAVSTSASATLTAKTSTFNLSKLTALPFPHLYQPGFYPLIWSYSVDFIPFSKSYSQAISLK